MATVIDQFAQVDPSVITAAGGKFIRAKDGRVVEYSVHLPKTSEREPKKQNLGPDIVLVTAYVADYLIATKHQTYKYKTISLSLPGCGHSDFFIGRQDISKWPQTDLEPVLEHEGVEKFIMWGDSLGTQYAMAVGQYFDAERLLAVGLRVPFLPRNISVPNNLPPGQPTLPSTDEIAKNTIKVKLTRWGLSLAVLFMNPGPVVKWCILKGLLGGNLQKIMKYIQDYPEQGKYLQNFVQYFGAESMLHACAEDVILDSTVDPQEMKVAKDGKIVVWYAADDQDCPPSHGKWMVDNLQCYHHRVFDGYGHVGGAFLDMDIFFDKLVECGSSF